MRPTNHLSFVDDVSKRRNAERRGVGAGRNI